jgi:hypothetical protein
MNFLCKNFRNAFTLISPSPIYFGWRLSKLAIVDIFDTELKSSKLLYQFRDSVWRYFDIFAIFSLIVIVSKVDTVMTNGKPNISYHNYRSPTSIHWSNRKYLLYKRNWVEIFKLTNLVNLATPSKVGYDCIDQQFIFCLKIPFLCIFFPYGNFH